MESDGEKEEEGHIAEEGPAKKKQRNIQEESEFNGIYNIDCAGLFVLFSIQLL